MKKCLTVIAALAILPAAAYASAALPQKHYGKATRKYFSYGTGWYPHASDKLQVGSAAWWRQMLRENKVRN